MQMCLLIYRNLPNRQVPILQKFTEPTRTHSVSIRVFHVPCFDSVGVLHWHISSWWVWFFPKRSFRFYSFGSMFPISNALHYWSEYKLKITAARRSSQAYLARVTISTSGGGELAVDYGRRGKNCQLFLNVCLGARPFDSVCRLRAHSSVVYHCVPRWQLVLWFPTDHFLLEQNWHDWQHMSLSCGLDQ